MRGSDISRALGRLVFLERNDHSEPSCADLKFEVNRKPPVGHFVHILHQVWCLRCRHALVEVKRLEMAHGINDVVLVKAAETERRLPCGFRD